MGNKIGRYQKDYVPVCSYQYKDVYNIMEDLLDCEGEVTEEDVLKLKRKLSLYQFGYHCDKCFLLWYCDVPFLVKKDTSLDFLQRKVLPWIKNNYYPDDDGSEVTKVCIYDDKENKLTQENFYPYLKKGGKVYFSSTSYVSCLFCL